MPVDLKPYLQALSRAVIKPAPPWPKAAQEYMVANSCKLLGWYDGKTEEGAARIYLNFRDPAHRNPEELLHTASEELCHHLQNNLPEGAVKAVALSLLGYSRWKAALAVRLLGLVCVAPIRRSRIS